MGRRSQPGAEPSRPARIVDFVYQSLRKHGHVHRVEIGAVAQEITPTMAEGLQLELSSIEDTLKGYAKS